MIFLADKTLCLHAYKQIDCWGIYVFLINVFLSNKQIV